MSWGDYAAGVLAIASAVLLGTAAAVQLALWLTEVIERRRELRRRRPAARSAVAGDN